MAAEEASKKVCIVGLGAMGFQMARPKDMDAGLELAAAGPRGR